MTTPPWRRPSDYIVVLDWGLHWLTSGPGSIDEYQWFKKVAEYAATMPDRSKFILGMPMYGIDWAGGRRAAGPGHAAGVFEHRGPREPVPGHLLLGSRRA